MKQEFYTEEERKRIGVKNIKRNILGFFGIKKIVSIDELVACLVGNPCLIGEGVVSDSEKAKEIISHLDRCTFDYGKYHHLRFDKVCDSLGNIKYRVLAYEED